MKEAYPLILNLEKETLDDITGVRGMYNKTLVVPQNLKLHVIKVCKLLLY